LIMTSNIGAEVIKNQSSLGFQKHSEEATYEKMKERLMKEVEKHFRPEFLNRLDDIIVFRGLTRDNIKVIIDIELAHVKGRLAQRGIELRLTEEAKELVVNEGFSTEFGARPLKRAIERLIEDPLSEEILRGALQGVKLINLSVCDGHLVFSSASKETEKGKEEVAAVGK